MLKGLEKVKILPTDKSPEILLDPDGIIKIKGRGLTVNRTNVPEQILEWVELYLGNAAETTYVIIAFEYLNSFNTAVLVSILRKLSHLPMQSKKLIIQWYYEPDDHDLLERGEYVVSVINMPIEFIKTDNIAGL